MQAKSRKSNNQNEYVKINFFSSIFIFPNEEKYTNKKIGRLFFISRELIFIIKFGFNFFMFQKHFARIIPKKIFYIWWWWWYWKRGKEDEKNKINEIPVHVNQLWRDKGTLIDQVVYVYNIWEFIYKNSIYIHKRKEE